MCGIVRMNIKVRVFRKRRVDMSHGKAIISIFLMCFSLGVLATQSEPDMNDKKTLVISHDYSADRVLKESTTKLVKNSDDAFHGKEKDVNVILLGEKQKIIIPGISETFLSFHNNLRSVTLYLLPIGHWSTLKTSIAQLKQIQIELQPLKSIAINTKEFDLSKLNEETFKDNSAEAISVYNLEHSKVVLILRKLNTPKEIHPRDQDYFQVEIAIDIN